MTKKKKTKEKKEKITDADYNTAKVLYSLFCVIDDEIRLLKASGRVN